MSSYVRTEKIFFLLKFNIFYVCIGVLKLWDFMVNRQNSSQM